MAITSAKFGAEAVDALSRSGIKFAFLHRESEASSGILVGDYDLAVKATTAKDILRRASEAWVGTGLRPVVASEYDAGSVTVWLSTPTAEDGVQIDFTYDRTGVNQLGYPLGEWVDESVDGERWPRVNPDRESAYRERKAALKLGKWKPSPSAARLAAEAARLRRRIQSPAGFWVHLQRSRVQAEAAELAARFGRFLPTAREVDLMRTHRLGRTWPTLVAPVIYRPGVLVTHSPMAWAKHADLVMDSMEVPDVDLWAETLTAKMASRLAVRITAQVGHG